MRKFTRKLLVRATLEKLLAKNERRIQQIAEESYQIRQNLAKLDAEPKKEPFVKPIEEK